MNTPLHWGIYWADLDLSKLVYNEFPDQLFIENKEGHIPFDMCIEAKNKFQESRAKIVNYGW